MSTFTYANTGTATFTWKPAVRPENPRRTKPKATPKQSPIRSKKRTAGRKRK